MVEKTLAKPASSKNRNLPNSMSSEKTNSNKVAWTNQVSLNGKKTESGLNYYGLFQFQKLEIYQNGMD